MGLFGHGKSEPDTLLAFAVGHNHGDHVQYSHAASTRDTGGLPLPLGYALAWHIICWGKDLGAEWFDFGGITQGSHDSGDRLGGISDFKRYFTKTVETVGDEWVLEVRPVRSFVARVLSTTAAALGQAACSLRSTIRRRGG